MRATRHASSAGHRRGGLSEQGVANACVIKAVVAGDGLDGSGHRTSIDAHMEHSPILRLVRGPGLIGNTRDLAERCLLRVEAGLPVVAARAAQVKARRSGQRKIVRAERNQKSRIAQAMVKESLAPLPSRSRRTSAPTASGLPNCARA